MRYRETVVEVERAAADVQRRWRDRPQAGRKVGRPRVSRDRSGQPVGHPGVQVDRAVTHRQVARAVQVRAAVDVARAVAEFQCG